MEISKKAESKEKEWEDDEGRIINSKYLWTGHHMSGSVIGLFVYICAHIYYVFLMANLLFPFCNKEIEA